MCTYMYIRTLCMWNCAFVYIVPVGQKVTWYEGKEEQELEIKEGD